MLEIGVTSMATRALSRGLHLLPALERVRIVNDEKDTDSTFRPRIDLLPQQLRILMAADMDVAFGAGSEEEDDRINTLHVPSERVPRLQSFDFLEDDGCRAPTLSEGDIRQAFSSGLCELRQLDLRSARG
jgi:hypothetical protein